MTKKIEEVLMEDFNRPNVDLFNETIEKDGVTYSVERMDDGSFGSVQPIGGQYTGPELPPEQQYSPPVSEEVTESSSDATHAALIVAGAYPGATGLAADATDLLLNLSEGEYWEAVQSGIRALPGIGIPIGIAKINKMRKLKKAAEAVRTAKQTKPLKYPKMPDKSALQGIERIYKTPVGKTAYEGSKKYFKDQKLFEKRSKKILSDWKEIMKAVK